MKQREFILSILFLFISVFSVESQAHTNRRKKENTDSRTVGYLAIRNGTILFSVTIFPMKVIGEIKVESSGIRFIPDVELAKPYKKVYPYNSLIKELYIPYGEIEKIKNNRGIVIRTKDRSRYRIIVNRPGRLIAKIRINF